MNAFHRGYNTVDRIKTNMIEYDLDDPDVEGSGAVDLESMGHYGDSGSGALYEDADGTLRIIGVKSNGSTTAYYGSKHEYTYIGDYHSTWIQANIDSLDTHVGADNCGPPMTNGASVYGTCRDINFDSDGNELADSWGDACSDYIGNAHWCGLYNTNVFNSNMCCACPGGGEQISDDEGDDGDDSNDDNEGNDSDNWDDGDDGDDGDEVSDGDGEG